MGETLHVAYKKYRIKENLPFSVNTIYISSRELKTSGFFTGAALVKIQMFSSR